MKKQLCCLTGATGHVGYAILKELQNHPEKDVKIIIRRDPGIFEGLNCEKVKGDITDYESLLKAFQGADIVYHVAGCVEIKPGNEDFVYDVNVNGTKNVLRACRKAGVKRLVYMSSVDTYVPLPEGEVMREVYHYDPDELEGTYAKTKAEATQLVLDANKPGVLETVVCQPSACMGPYDFKVSSVGSMIRMFSSGHFPITMTFGGYNFVDVRDVALGTIAAGDKGGAGQVYILCNQSCTVDEFITQLAEVCGNKPPKIKLGKGLIDFAAPLMEGYYKAARKPAIFTRYAVRKLCSNCNFSFEKAQKELGYNPRPLRESLADTIAWIAEEEERQRQLEIKKAEEEERRKEEEKLRKEEEKLKAEEEEQRLKEEEKLRKEEEKRLREEEEQRLIDEERAAREKEKKLKEEEKQRRDLEKQQKKAEDRRVKAEEKSKKKETAESSAAEENAAENRK